MRGKILPEQITAITGDLKVSTIRHLQGGYDTRHIAAVSLELMASITNMPTPHKGFDFADFKVKVGLKI